MPEVVAPLDATTRAAIIDPPFDATIEADAGRDYGSAPHRAATSSARVARLHVVRAEVEHPDAVTPMTERRQGPPGPGPPFRRGIAVGQVVSLGVLYYAFGAAGPSAAPAGLASARARATKRNETPVLAAVAGSLDEGVTLAERHTHQRLEALQRIDQQALPSPGRAGAAQYEEVGDQIVPKLT